MRCVRTAYGPRSKARANVSNGRRERRRRMVVCRVCKRGVMRCVRAAYGPRSKARANVSNGKRERGGGGGWSL